jgi:WD40 repeat protein
MLYDIKSSSYLERDLSSGSLSGSVSGSLPLMTACLFNHNSQMLLTGATDGKIRIFDLRKRECIASWSVAGETEVASKNNVLSLQVSYILNLLFYSLGDRGIRERDI